MWYDGIKNLKLKEFLIRIDNKIVQNDLFSKEEGWKLLRYCEEARVNSQKYIYYIYRVYGKITDFKIDLNASNFGEMFPKHKKIYEDRLKDCIPDRDTMKTMMDLLRQEVVWQEHADKVLKNCAAIITGYRYAKPDKDILETIDDFIFGD